MSDDQQTSEPEPEPEALAAGKIRRGNWWQVSIKGLLLLTLVATAYFAGLGFRLRHSRDKDHLSTYPAGDGTPLKKDFMLNSLPNRVAAAYSKRFSDTRIWSVVESKQAGMTLYELTVFDDRSPTSHFGMVNGRLTHSLLHHQLVVDEQGNVVSEGIHALFDRAVPTRVRDAFAQWRKEYPRGDGHMEWYAEQQRGQARRYTGRVVLNSIEAYSAVLDEKGKILKSEVNLRKK